MSLHGDGPQHIPVSLEWTVPFPPGELHIGVHNLPPGDARQIMSALSSYTVAPEESKLAGLFEHLDQFREVLVVLNHPLWEMDPIGERAVWGMVRTFLARYGRWVHALEVNGLRPWAENRRVIEMARNLNYPLVSGGDRHGCEPSAMLNLTNAATFAEFVSQVREGGACEIVTMPQYREPLNLRILQVVWDVPRDDRGLAGEERRWTERVFFELADGAPKPLSQCWKGEPPELRLMMGFTRALEAPPLRAALRLAFAGGERGALCNNPPRVALFTDCFHEVNGAAHSCRQLVQYAASHKLPFLSVHSGPRTELMQEGSVTKLELQRGPATFPVDVDFGCDLLIWRYAKMVESVLEQFRPDLVHVISPCRLQRTGRLPCPPIWRSFDRLLSHPTPPVRCDADAPVHRISAFNPARAHCRFCAEGYPGRDQTLLQNSAHAASAHPGNLPLAGTFHGQTVPLHGARCRH